jgi:hypothetical protein
MDIGDKGAQEELLARLRAFREELDLHAHLEETFIHPTLSLRLPGGSRRLEDEHVLMHRQLDDILSMAAAAVALDPRLPERRQLDQELYLAWSRFIAFYLAHINDEEERVQTALWKLCSDAEVRGMFGQLIAAQTPQQLASGLMSMLPSMSRDARVEMLTSINEPPPKLMDMLNDVSKRALGPEDYEDLRNRANLP